MADYNDLFDLTGKTAVVTGGAGILGTEFCAGLAAHGASVAVVDIDEEAASDLAEQLREERGAAAIAVPCDVSDPDSVEQMVDEVKSAFGDIDILLNNAATKSDDLDAFFSRDEEYSLDEWRKIMAVNLDGMFLVAKAVGGEMIDQAAGGAIVQTASIYGVRGPDERVYEGSEYLGHEIRNPAAYSASKGGVVALSRHLATTWASDGVRVNTLVPGGVASGQNETFQKKYGDRVPMGRMAEREDLVGAVVYLVSEAACYVTGQKVVVDGGLTAW
jgi:NAD(P)-dependent dehydrogenase (short-subunit alcohol dehydrogenase family)